MRKFHEGCKRQTNNKFLNMYEVDALDRDGRHFPYYFATRNEERDMVFHTGRLVPDGAVIYSVLKENPEKLVLVKQYRYPVDMYVYEVPAGLIDAGEQPEETAVREMKEETGLDLEVYREGDIALKRPFIQAQGMADECNCLVAGYASGSVSYERQESSEAIEAVLADKEEVKRILREEPVSVRGAYLMMLFLQSTKEDPFAFLRL